MNLEKKIGQKGMTRPGGGVKEGKNCLTRLKN
jgi:hypothetical protein